LQKDFYFCITTSVLEWWGWLVLLVVLASNVLILVGDVLEDNNLICLQFLDY
jgi:hypothetical protein